MRILAIRGCNLASLAGEFEIDLAHGPLAEAGVFAIVGNTGAGKSTLLDALCAALFDRTPRLTNHSRVVVGRGDDDPGALGAQDVRTILRRGASTGWAEVDFESRDDRRYRARWSVRRARGHSDGNLQDQQVTLTSIDGNEHLGGTKTETLKAIHARLGLTFDQFRRSALLAQGEFAAFLRADGRDRSELLERMTGTEIYSKLSIAAHVRAALAEQRLREGRTAALAIAVLDDAARAAAQDELVLARVAKDAARARLAAAEAASRWLAEAKRRDDALAGADRDRVGAEQAVELAAPERAELALRRRADTVRAVWNDAERLERRFAIAAGEVTAAATEVERAELARRDIAATSERLRAAHEPVRAARLAAGLVERPAAATSAEARARAAAADSAWLLARASLAAEVATWLELDAKFSQHESVVDAIASADRALRGHAEHHAKIKRTRDTAAGEHQQASAQLGDAQRHAASYAARRGPTLDVARRREDEARQRCADVDRLVAIAEGARDAAHARTEIDRQLAEQAAAIATDVTNRAAAESARQIAVAVRSERARAVAELRNAAGYEHARAELVAGDACPLCGATEHPWHDRGAFDDVIRDGEARLAEVVATLDATTHTIAAITARSAAREDERERLVTARDVAEASATSAVPAWREQLSALGELMLVDEPATPAAKALAADRQAAATASLEEARSIRSQAEAATKAANDAQAQIQTWQSNVDLIDGTLRDLDRKLADIDATMGKLRAEREVRVGHQRALATELDAAFTRWSAIAGDLQGGTLDARRVAMAAVAKMWHLRATAVVEADGSVQAALALVEQTAREIERVAAEQTARRDEAVRRRDELADEHAAARARLDAARAATGFELDELRRLLAADPGRADVLAERQAELDRAVERARAVVAERRRLHGDHQVSRPPCLDDAGQVGALATLAAEADHHVARLDAALAADADAQRRRAAALAQVATVEAAGDVDRVLGDVIGSHDGKLFRSFAQSLTLDSLLAVANSHLEELAPRYQLERVPRHDLELQVVDRDLGAEVRSVQSLSGGESFLVSLALALGLSSMSAHDVRVRTLLIDEGFGTLDPATLDTALSVLDALQATGRQVGVISHVPALVERVGAHVAVVQRGGGRSEVIVA